MSTFTLLHEHVATTTTTQPPEKAQAGWSVASTSSRGVLVDYKDLVVDGAKFRAIRLRARTTLLRWHVGSTDPALHASVPVDANQHIDWTNEGLAGVVAVFNGGFKQSAKAGGEVVDNVTLVPLVKGDMTIALDASGHWEMGVWGSANFPSKKFVATTYRQNLGPMVLNGQPTSAVLSKSFMAWGDPLKEHPATPRTGLGVDAKGNLVFVASETGVLPVDIAKALVAAGAVSGMELDMNPYWPILGAAKSPQHFAPGTYPVQLPGGGHSPTIYATGWERDFFVALAEPNAWTCSWQAPGISTTQTGAQPQPLKTVGSGCSPTTTTSSAAG